MHLLLKHFESKHYLNEFLSGSLYMNTLNYFWNEGFEEQNDVFEGVVCTIPASKFNIIPITWQQIQACDYRFRAEGYSFCNVLCFERLDFTADGDLINALFSESMMDFGQDIAIIHDENELIRRVENAVNKNHYKYLCGDVHYHELKKDGKSTKEGDQLILKGVDQTFDIDWLRGRFDNTTSRDCFDKSAQYSDQREWRIALYRGVKDTGAYRLEVGDLKDIVTVSTPKTLKEDIQKIINRYGVCQYDGYNGNMSRKELRKYFCDLGDNKASLFMTVGK